MNISRRSLLIGLGASVVAAPAIIRVINLMPIKPAPLIIRTSLPMASWRKINWGGRLCLTPDISSFTYYDEAYAASKELEQRILHEFMLPKDLRT